MAQIGLTLTIALTLLQGAPAAAPQRDSVLEARTREVASILRCPVCQGLSIQDSPSPLAQEMRGVVRDQLRAGRTPQEVKAYFVSKYGEWILLQPTARGFNLAVYILPVVMLLGGIVLIVVLARKWSRQAVAEPEQVHAIVERSPE
jgi:cytochrome c-type biogenesis protein CcmH